MSLPITLKLYRGDELVRTQTFERDLVKIGTLTSAHLRLEGQGVGRMYCFLTRDSDGRLAVIDIAGATFLNGKRVNKALLQPGDELGVGGHRIVVGPVADVAAPQHGPELPPTPPSPEPSVLAVEPAPTLARPAAEQAPAPSIIEELTAEPAVEPSLQEPEPPAGSAPVDASPPGADSAHLALQVRYLWGDTLLQVSQHAAPCFVRVGSSQRSDLPLSADVLGASEYTLVSTGADGRLLHVGKRMRGTRTRDGRTAALAPGIYDLRPGDVATIELGGGIRAELAFRGQPPRVARRQLRSLDYRFVNVTLLLLMLGGAFAISVRFRDQTDVEADQLDTGELERARVVFQDIQRPKPPVIRVRPTEVEPPEPDRERPRKAGRAGSRPRQGRPLPLGSLSSAQLAAGATLPQIFGGPAATQVLDAGLGDLKAATSNLQGALSGQAGGFGGLQLRGSPSGSGIGNPLGIGGIDTLGRGGHREGYGLNAGGLPGKKVSGPPRISGGETTVVGGVDRELVRNVIRGNALQIRFCYEQELQRQPALAGRVAVRFTIGPAGEVTSASISEGTTLLDPALHSCVLTRVHRWRFPMPKGGGSAVVTYPFVFRLAGE